MPPIGVLRGRINFADRFINLSGTPYASLQAAKAAGAATINYGLFINTLIDFVIVAFVIFLLVKQVNRLKSRPPQTPTTKDCPYCFSSIAIRATRCPACTSALDVAKG